MLSWRPGQSGVSRSTLTATGVLWRLAVWMARTWRSGWYRTDTCWTGPGTRKASTSKIDYRPKGQGLVFGLVHLQHRGCTGIASDEWQAKQVFG
ncbi:hypothetical protein ACVMB1_006135 [Bradyrhizobium sp. USDA 4504]